MSLIVLLKNNLFFRETHFQRRGLDVIDHIRQAANIDVRVFRALNIFLQQKLYVRRFTFPRFGTGYGEDIVEIRIFSG